MKKSITKDIATDFRIVKELESKLSELNTKIKKMMVRFENLVTKGVPFDENIPEKLIQLESIIAPLLQPIQNCLYEYEKNLITSTTENQIVIFSEISGTHRHLLNQLNEFFPRWEKEMGNLTRRLEISDYSLISDAQIETKIIPLLKKCMENEKNKGLLADNERIHKLKGKISLLESKLKKDGALIAISKIHTDLDPKNIRHNLKNNKGIIRTHATAVVKDLRDELLSINKEITETLMKFDPFLSKYFSFDEKILERLIKLESAITPLLTTTHNLVSNEDYLKSKEGKNLAEILSKQSGCYLNSIKEINTLLPAWKKEMENVTIKAERKNDFFSDLSYEHGVRRIALLNQRINNEELKGPLANKERIKVLKNKCSFLEGKISNKKGKTHNESRFLDEMSTAFNLDLINRNSQKNNPKQQAPQVQAQVQAQPQVQPQPQPLNVNGQNKNNAISSKTNGKSSSLNNDKMRENFIKEISDLIDNLTLKHSLNIKQNNANGNSTKIDIDTKDFQMKLKEIISKHSDYLDLNHAIKEKFNHSIIEKSNHSPDGKNHHLKNIAELLEGLTTFKLSLIKDNSEKNLGDQNIQILQQKLGANNIQNKSGTIPSKKSEKSESLDNDLNSIEKIMPFIKDVKKSELEYPSTEKEKSLTSSDDIQKKVQDFISNSPNFDFIKLIAAYDHKPSEEISAMVNSLEEFLNLKDEVLLNLENKPELSADLKKADENPTNSSSHQKSDNVEKNTGVKKQGNRHSLFPSKQVLKERIQKTEEDVYEAPRNNS